MPNNETESSPPDAARAPTDPLPDTIVGVRRVFDRWERDNDYSITDAIADLRGLLGRDAARVVPEIPLHERVRGGRMLIAMATDDSTERGGQKPVAADGAPSENNQERT